MQTGDVVRRSKVVEKSMANVVNRHGARQPAYAKAKKKYQLGTVLVTVSRWPTPAEMTTYHLTMENFASSKSGDGNHPTTVYPSWDWATRGRSRRLVKDADSER